MSTNSGHGVATLKAAGALSGGVALLHILIIFVGAPAYRYFGAGELMARLAERGSWAPAGITLALTLIFGVWAAYGFSGAGTIPRLPLLRTGLIAIGTVYTLRGLALVPELFWFFSEYRHLLPTRRLVFSGASLLIGLVYLLGTRRAWASLRPGRS